MSRPVIGWLYLLLRVEDLSASRPDRLTRGGNKPVSVGQEAGWAPEPVCIRWTRDEILRLPGTSTVRRAA